MIVNENEMVANTYASIVKSYNNARMRGKLKSTDTYILDAISSVMTICTETISEELKDRLFKMYNHILDTSEETCRVARAVECSIGPDPKFYQQNIEECDNYPIYDDIFYWQETLLSSNITNIKLDVLENDYFDDKSTATIQEFAIGKYIPYSNIGVVCFAILDSIETADFRIYDFLKNEVTSAFDTVFIPEIKGRLFVSQNVYSHGVMQFTIKKIN